MSDSDSDGLDVIELVEVPSAAEFMPEIAESDESSPERPATPSSLGSAPDVRDLDEIEATNLEDFKPVRAPAVARNRRPQRRSRANSDFDGESTLDSRSSWSRGDLRGRGRGRGGRGRGPGRGQAISVHINVVHNNSENKVVQQSAPPPPPPPPPVDEEYHTPYFMITVAILDLVLLGWEILMQGGFVPFMQNPMLGPSRDILVTAGAKYGPKISAGEYWRFVTPMFLHVGIIHLLFNLIFTLRVGWSLEKQHGFLRIMPIYILSGIHGNLLSVIFLPTDVSVGASSSLFGFFGIMLVDLIQNWALIRRPGRALCGLIFQLIFSLAIGLLPGIDNFAHLGGLIMGIVAGFIFIPAIGKKVSAQRVFTMILALFIMVVIFSVGFASFFGGEPASKWCTGCENINCLHVLNWCSDPFAAITQGLNDLGMGGTGGFPGFGGGGGGGP